MPSEERHIEFSDAEAAAAVQRFVRKRHEGRTTVAIRHVKPVADGNAITGVHAIGHQGLERVQLELALAELTAALLSWCFTSQVPIPRQATKQVTFTRNSFTLILMTPPALGGAVDEQTPGNA